MTHKLELVLTGTGRCATGFYSKLLTSAGLPCGHEAIFGPYGMARALVALEERGDSLRADSSWLAAPFLNSDILKDAFVVHLIRHPKDVIESAAKIRQAGMAPQQYHDFNVHHLPGMDQHSHLPTMLAYRYVHWNRLIEGFLQDGRPSYTFYVDKQEPMELLAELHRQGLINLDQIDQSRLFNNRKYNTKTAGTGEAVSLTDIHSPVREELEEISQQYGYAWPESSIPHLASVEQGKPVVKAVITTLDNLPNLKETIDVLRTEPIDQIIVVDNGSKDGTAEWLYSLGSTTAHIGVLRPQAGYKGNSLPVARSGSCVFPVIRENRGAGPGRNAGLDAAEPYDYVLMLDGGIRPLYGGTSRMLDYIKVHPGCDVLGLEIPHFETDYEKAWRRWPDPIEKTYVNRRLSHTAYALARFRAFDGLRFSEDGPFGEPGWGVDDDEMAYRWNEAGITVHVVTNVHPYRRASGSFRRLYKETGIWPNQYGSVYEKRLVYCQQNWPQYQPGMQWGEPWLTVVVQVGDVQETAKLIKHAHNRLRERTFKKPWDYYPNPYSIVAWGDDLQWLRWATPRFLRQHHGDTVVLDEYGPQRKIIKRTEETEDTWTGDFRIWTDPDWRSAIRPDAFYYGLVTNMPELSILLDTYNDLHPPKLTRMETPTERREIELS